MCTNLTGSSIETGIGVTGLIRHDSLQDVVNVEVLVRDAGKVCAGIIQTTDHERLDEDSTGAVVYLNNITLHFRF